MRLEKDQKNYIVEAFHSMQGREDFLNLLNYAKKIIYGEKTIFFDLRQLTYYSNPNTGARRYVSFEIPKKNRDPRTIHAPVRGLLVIQKCLNLILGCVFTPVKFATGFVQGVSIVDNAAFHAGNYYVYNLDLKDFFHSFDQARVWKCLQLKPLNLSVNQNLQQDRAYLDVANIISALVCTRLEVKRYDKEGNAKLVPRNVLPQGAPTSPIITNIVCQKLDYLLSAAAKRFGLKYSRYADDITFSSLHNVYQKNSEFLHEVRRIIFEQGFVVNEQKVRLQKDGFKQMVTGLVVNKHPNVSKKFIDRIKIDLYYWERYGYERANKFFLKYYKSADKSKNTSSVDMSRVLLGRLQFLKMVRGADNNMFKKLDKRLRVLLEKRRQADIPPEEVHFRMTREIEVVPAPAGLFKADFKEVIDIMMANLYISGTDKKEILDAAHRSLEKQGFVQEPFSLPEGARSIVPVEARRQEHSPRDVARFMSLFNQRDGLKYLTHDFDEEGEFRISFFLEKWKNIFGQASKGRNGYEIPSSLYRIINEFAFSGKPNWTSANGRSVYEGWSTDKWVNWSTSNRLHALRNPGFKVVIDDFRRLTRIESPNLEHFIKEAAGEALGPMALENSLKLEDVYKADFYTHVPSLKRALISIFSMMAKYGGDNSIDVSYKRSTDGDFFVRQLIITQHDSYPTKDLNQILSDWNGEKGTMGGIKSNLYGYCNWSIVTMIDDLACRVNILREKGTPDYEIIEKDDVIGFTHILTYYYL
jgi:RNA-directed DNA polymerase